MNTGEHHDPVPPGTTEDPTPPAKRSRLRTHQEQLTRKVETTRQRFEEKRPDSRAVDAVFRAASHDTAAGGSVLAGAVAFRLFLFLIPYVFVLIVGFGAGAGAADQNPGKLARKAGVGGLIANSVKVSSNLSTFTKITSLVVGLFALALAARSLMKVLRVVHALVWGIRAPKPKSATKQAAVLVAITTVFLAGSWAIGWLRGESFLLGLVAMLLSSVLPMMVWLGVSWVLPHREATWRELVPGAVLFGVGVLVLHVVTVYWIARTIENKTDTYGAIGAALGILLWAYLLGRVITSAAVLNATLWNQEHEGVLENA